MLPRVTVLLPKATVTCVFGAASLRYPVAATVPLETVVATAWMYRCCAPTRNAPFAVVEATSEPPPACSATCGTKFTLSSLDRNDTVPAHVPVS